ncbi:adenylate kinase [Trypanosoma grayi]|uniref:adenylate kinase n=1 Tax=Trypanosoma grayi TaxID=71804 RepID=UPI0004F49B63|nr:adenylate kinase [Trypanosoma grayi]KEG10749.1 adenylate kinase [Trypanosoma grayi]
MSTGDLSEDSVTYLEEKHIKPLLEELFHDVLLHLPEDPLEFLLRSLEGKTSLRMMIVGPSGSGKLTQSRRIAQKYGVVLVNADEIFREEMEKNMEEGKTRASWFREGNAVPSDVAAELIIKRLNAEDAARNGWVLDGFPRTRSQALRLQEAGMSPMLFAVLDVPAEVAVQRCAGRRYDPITQNVYHEKYVLPPAGTMVEPTEDGDASLATVVGRWKYFDARKDELIECYEPFFVRINGDQSVERVFEEVCEQVDSRFVSV